MNTRPENDPPVRWSAWFDRLRSTLPARNALSKIRFLKQVLSERISLRLENLYLRGLLFYQGMQLSILRLEFQFLDIAFTVRFWWESIFHNVDVDKRSNDPSSATRPTRAPDCNRDVMAGFAAAHG